MDLLASLLLIASLIGCVIYCHASMAYQSRVFIIKYALRSDPNVDFGRALADLIRIIQEVKGFDPQVTLHAVKVLAEAWINDSNHTEDRLRFLTPATLEVLELLKKSRHLHPIMDEINKQLINAGLDSRTLNLLNILEKIVGDGSYKLPLTINQSLVDLRKYCDNAGEDKHRDFINKIDSVEQLLAV